MIMLVYNVVHFVLQIYILYGLPGSRWCANNFFSPISKLIVSDIRSKSLLFCRVPVSCSDSLIAIRAPPTGFNLSKG